MHGSITDMRAAFIHRTRVKDTIQKLYMSLTFNLTRNANQVRQTTLAVL
jgi:hypothetical protein